VLNKFDRLANHIGKACSKTRMLKSLNCAFQGGEIFGRHFSLSRMQICIMPVHFGPKADIWSAKCQLQTSS